MSSVLLWGWAALPNSVKFIPEAQVYIVLLWGHCVSCPDSDLSPSSLESCPTSVLSLQGLYCVSVNCMDNAEAQFTTALRVRLAP